jgi:hypothetical protein
MQRHRPKLTLLLRLPAAPLDNICERALRKAMARENPFDYLVALQRHHVGGRRQPG